ncbi:MAG: PilZ domain-containing protein [Hyphomicrobiales bacterium]|nr:PilZ domain-containing protein [Hyphomicrobiales bacterium]
MKSRRRTTRYDCSLPANLEYKSGSVSCTIKDLSSGGLSIAISSFLRIEIGEQVTIVQNDLGKMAGSVRWVRMGTSGMRLDQNLTGLNMFSVIKINSSKMLPKLSTNASITPQQQE